MYIGLPEILNYSHEEAHKTSIKTISKWRGVQSRPEMACAVI